MARVFRFKKSIPADYDLQGYIYFTSRQFQRLPPGRQKKIRQLCREAAGSYAPALFEFVTTDAGAAEICGKHYLSSSALERMVKRYYALFSEMV